jgi:hypothetical protein
LSVETMLDMITGLTVWILLRARHRCHDGASITEQS